MKKIVVAIGLSSGLLIQSASADALKNSLSGMLNKKEETPAMVNLNGISLGSKPDRVKPKTRSAKAVIATVNGMEIVKKEADNYLSKRTKGKIKDFDLLPKKQRLALVKELALPMLLAEKAKKELSSEEKDAVLSRVWMQKSVAATNVPDEQVRAAYEKIKAQAKAQSALQQIPPFEAVKDRIKLQIIEQQVVAQLLNGAKIRVEPSSDTIAGYVGMMALTIDEVNKALQIRTNGKMTWATLPEKERKRVLQMVAPAKLIALAAKNGLSNEEQDTALANYWMQKKLSRISVTDEEAKRRYEKIKKMAKRSQNKKKLPEYTELEKSLKMQIAQEKFIEKLTKKAKITLK
ncbi:hypothetical protein ACM66Z_03000 [Sulfurovum sp. ST-21]|uniref:PpiC domain-containing protein n=1 Tax=Sulfurovum indicum TaxID=2779528 RepID=A0A7M1S6X7_9BACT|nr:hypothetical protein [Sulfurovum indicum]QOR62459.1 hypothetical protein IMZ28_02985 [Sulfurovum indicum]